VSEARSAEADEARRLLEKLLEKLVGNLLCRRIGGAY